MAKKLELTFKQIKELVKLGLVKSKKKRRKNGKSRRVISKKDLIRALEQSGHNMNGIKSDSSHMVGSVNYPLSNMGNTLQTDAMRIANERAELDLRQQKEKRPVTDSKKKYLLDSIPIDNRIDIDDEELFNMYQNNRKKLEYIKIHHPFEYTHIRNNPSSWNDDTWEAYNVPNDEDLQTVTTRATKRSYLPGDELHENDEEDAMSDITRTTHNPYENYGYNLSPRFTQPRQYPIGTTGASMPFKPRQTESASDRFRDQGNPFESAYDPVNVAVEVRNPAEHDDDTYQTESTFGLAGLYDKSDDDTYKTDSTHHTNNTFGIGDVYAEKIDIPTGQENPLKSIEMIKAHSPSVGVYDDGWIVDGITPVKSIGASKDITQDPDKFDIDGEQKDVEPTYATAYATADEDNETVFTENPQIRMGTRSKSRFPVLRPKDHPEEVFIPEEGDKKPRKKKVTYEEPQKEIKTSPLKGILKKTRADYKLPELQQISRSNGISIYTGGRPKKMSILYDELKKAGIIK